MAAYAGNHWYKCDLHLHTMCSDCYPEKDNTPEMWVDRALEQGLDVCAVTDHNDYRGITAMMEEGKKKGLAVFPGVEITCDSSKIHILVLFDISKNADTVRDFLNRCDIDSELIGSSDGTSLSVFEVCQIAKRRGAIVIAAHIDEFNSISSMNPANLDRLFESGLLDAVQVVNASVWEQYDKDKDADAMNKAIREAYGSEISSDLIETWRKCFNRAKEMGLPMLSFSDNPHSPEESKHGLWGIGSVYTWIQMDESIDIESLRQSFITPDGRLRLSYHCEEAPKSEPDFWIRSLDIRKTELNPFQPVHLEFHPQLNCIIGGRGSGKTSLVRLLSGVYRQLESGILADSIKDENEFYKQLDSDGFGIFHEDSEIEIIFKWYGDDYRLLVTDINSVRRQKHTLYWISPEGEQEVTSELGEEGFKALMSARVYVQRQVYEMAIKHGSLLEHIDASISDMYIYKHNRDYLLNRMLLVSMEINEVSKALYLEKRVREERDWLKGIESQYIDVSRRDNMIGLRDEAVGKMIEGHSHLEYLKKEFAEFRDAYEKSLDTIREARINFIREVLGKDENYKIDLNANQDKQSFYHMLDEVLGVDRTLISEDIKVLEKALYDTKNKTEAYEELLLKVRRRQDTPFTDYFKHLVCGMNHHAFQRMLLFIPEDELLLSYHPNGVKRFFPMTMASSGEKSEAILAFILSEKSWPLIIDQPEDDLDNRVIYEELIAKIKRAKQNRQLIIVTHNANIATNADAEMIISMDPKSKYTKVRMSGSTDNPEIRKEICDVLEGTEQAFRQRSRKYHFE